MKFTHLVLAMFIAFFVLACASKEPTVLDKRVASHIVFQDLEPSLIRDFNYKNNVNDLLEFELVLQSEDDEDISYKISWLDEDGFRVSTLKDEEFIKVSLKANNEFIIKRVAANKDIKDFKITLVRN